MGISVEDCIPCRAPYKYGTARATYYDVRYDAIRKIVIFYFAVRDLYDLAIRWYGMALVIPSLCGT